MEPALSQCEHKSNHHARAAIASEQPRRHACNIPREYYLKINNKRNKFINSRLDKNPNAGIFNFMKMRAKTYIIISQWLQVPIIRVHNKNLK